MRLNSAIRILAAAAALLSTGLPSRGWGATGHKIVVALAQRHLTQNTGTALSQLFSYDYIDDASWADKHRKDEEYLFTDSYHTMAMNKDYLYDPGWRSWSGGDCVTGLDFFDWNLSHRQQLHLTDSVCVFNVRMVLHVVGDMHCLCHSYVMPEKNLWDCTYKGTAYTYHSFFDKAPELMYEGLTPAKVAAKIDTWPEERIKACGQGTFIDWAQECCTRDKIIYDVNPYGTATLDPDTLEKTGPAVVEALQYAGYRLAYLLNKYFDK